MADRGVPSIELVGPSDGATVRSGRGAVLWLVALALLVAAVAGALVAHRDAGGVAAGNRNARLIPLSLGGGANVIGADGGSSGSELWASISGPYTSKEYGDPYATTCAGASADAWHCASGPNPEYRPDGYRYGIRVGPESVGQALTVQLFDAGHYNRANFPYTETADCTDPLSLCQPGNQSGNDARGNQRRERGVTTSYELLAVDPSAPDSPGAAPVAAACTSGPGAVVIAPETQAEVYENKWATLCTLTVDHAGTYGLRVRSRGIDGIADSGDGFNQYGVRASVPTGAQPSVYAIGDFSVFVNPKQGRTGADFPLAQVPETYAGDTLRIELFDPGDGRNGSAATSVVAPGGTAPACAYGVAGAAAHPVDRCQFTTRDEHASPPNPYNGQWVVIQIDLSADYHCVPDCTWRLHFDWSGDADDRATWTAHILDVTPEGPTPTPGSSPGTATTTSTTPRPSTTTTSAGSSSTTSTGHGPSSSTVTPPTVPTSTTMTPTSTSRTTSTSTAPSTTQPCGPSEDRNAADPRAPTTTLRRDCDTR